MERSSVRMPVLGGEVLGAEFVMCRSAHMLTRRRYYKSPGSEDGGVDKGGVAILEPAQLRGTVDRGEARSRLDCVTIRQIARSGRRTCCASDSQTGRRNFRQYCDSVAASIGAHSPGMVSVGKPARFTPIREWGRPFCQKKHAAHPKPDCGPQ